MLLALLYLSSPIALPNKPTLPEAPAGHIYREDNGVTKLCKVRYTRPNEPTTIYSLKQVAEHNDRNDAWVIVDDCVYDVTKFVNEHPGGWIPIRAFAGNDASDAFSNFHPEAVYKGILPKYFIGRLEKPIKYPKFELACRQLRQKLLRQHLFETDQRFYVLKFLWLLTLVASSLYFVFVDKRPILSGFLMGMFWQQVAFVGHDVGHNSISHSQKKDTYYGAMVGNALMGISLCWWKRDHNAHHIICNEVCHDPNVQHLPVFSENNRAVGRTFYSTYHDRWMSTDEMAWQLVTRQHWLFYPVMMVARFNLYVQSWMVLFSNKKVQFPWMERTSLLVFFLWLPVVAYQSGRPWLWILVSHVVTFILHVQISVSHVCMEMFEEEAYKRDDTLWYQLQCRTTLNVDCSPYVDWFHGGLQFQLEHHLYPRLPRHYLRYARDMVKQVCQDHGVEYHELDFVLSLIHI